MTNPYDDIIHLPHPVSPRRRHMTISERASQFAPFAALSGFSASIEEAGKQAYTAEDFFPELPEETSCF